MEGIAEDAPQEAKSTDKERPLTEDGTPKDAGDTMHVPMTFLQGTRFKEGDELVLKVVAVDDEGLEVAYAKTPRGSSSGDVGSELESLDGSPSAEGY